MDKKFLMTQVGYSKLYSELNRLINEERPSVIDALKESRTYGGELSENSEYLEAKDRQDVVEKKIAELKVKIESSKIVDIKEIADDGVARFGTIVTMVDFDDDKELIYQLVGEEEASIKEGKISYRSPLGAAVINKKLGDSVYFRTPNGERELEIIKITMPR
jgi:transcription elongation factor GreA